MAARKTSRQRRSKKSDLEEIDQDVEETTTSPGSKTKKKSSSSKKASKKSTPKKSAAKKRGRPRVSNTDTVRVTLRVEKDHMEVIDMLVRLKQYSNRSDALRNAIAQFCDEELENVEELVEKQQKRQKLKQLAALTDQLNELSGA